MLVNRLSLQLKNNILKSTLDPSELAAVSLSLQIQLQLFSLGSNAPMEDDIQTLAMEERQEKFTSFVNRFLEFVRKESQFDGCVNYVLKQMKKRISRENQQADQLRDDLGTQKRVLEDDVIEDDSEETHVSATPPGKNFG